MKTKIKLSNVIFKSYQFCYFILNRRFSSSVQENLRRGEGDLSDLISINIQRGRERGVSGYTKYRNLPLCGLPQVKSFEDLVRKANFDRKDVANLRKIYKNVHDIDFFVAGKSKNFKFKTFKQLRFFNYKDVKRGQSCPLIKLIKSRVLLSLQEKLRLKNSLAPMLWNKQSSEKKNPSAYTKYYIHFYSFLFQLTRKTCAPSAVFGAIFLFLVLHQKS